MSSWKPPVFSGRNEEDNPIEELDDDESEDYMSDAFITQCVNSTSDIRPGLQISHSVKRKRELENKRKAEALQKKKVKKISLEENISKGMNMALDSTNKGFSMLQKMGYKPGTSLGAKGDGRLEPVKVELKSDRKGLGLKQKLLEMKKEKELKYLAYASKKNAKFDLVKFREQKRLELNAKKIQINLSKCQRTCYNLDADQKVKEPMEWYFWPPHLLPQPENDDTEDCDTNELQNEESDNLESEEEHTIEPWQGEIYLEVITAYLRTQYLYCIWCGATFNDESDLVNNCPGPLPSDHDDEL